VLVTTRITNEQRKEFKQRELAFYYEKTLGGTGGDPYPFKNSRYINKSNRWKIQFLFIIYANYFVWCGKGKIKNGEFITNDWLTSKKFYEIFINEGCEVDATLSIQHRHTVIY
jgi:hypothetical protein